MLAQGIQILQAFDIRSAHAIELGVSAVEGRRTDAMSLASIRGCTTCLGLVQNGNDLRFAEAGHSHQTLLCFARLGRRPPRINGPDFGVGYNTPR